MMPFLRSNFATLEASQQLMDQRSTRNRLRRRREVVTMSSHWLRHVGFGFGAVPSLASAKSKILPELACGLLAEARAPLFHVKVEMILVGVIGLWPEHGAEFMTAFIVHMLHELGLKVRGRLRSDRGR